MAKLYTSPPKFSQMPTFIRDDMPVYRLRDDIYTDDTYFSKGSTIEADEDYEPNIAMFPVNEKAFVIYRDMLKAYDAKGEEYNSLPLDQRRGYMQHIPKLPAFEKEWKKVNNLAKVKGLHICQAVDQAPAILGAPVTKAPKVRSVDMSNVSQAVYESAPIIQGNKSTKNNSVAAVQAAV